MSKKIFLLKVIAKLVANEEQENWRGKLTSWIKC